MKHILGATKRTVTGSVAALFLLTAVAVAIPPQSATAAGLLYRSLQLSSSAPSGEDELGAGEEAAEAGEAANGAKVDHTYVFQVKTTGALEALRFQYCGGPFQYLDFDTGGTAGAACTPPAGFSAAAAPSAVVTLHDDVDEARGGTDAKATQTWAVLGANPAPVDKQIAVSGTAVTTTLTNSYVRVTFAATDTNYFVNPTAENQTFYAHIETFADDANVNTDNASDEGTVTSSTANTIAINTRVQETLNFSVEGEDDPLTPTELGPTTAEDNECNALTGDGVINMGNPSNSNSLSAARSYDAYSYFRLATNSAKGARVLYAGETLKSTAGDEIAAFPAVGAASDAGTEQFGMAFAQGFDSTATASPDVINDVVEEELNNDGLNTGTGDNDLYSDNTLPFYQGTVTFDGSNQANGTYAFDTTSNGSPKLLARSDGVVRCDTGVVRYVANISNDTPAGIYSTKISYIAVPSY